MKKEMGLVFLLIVGIVTPQLADSPWPMFHGSITHGGVSKYNTSHVDGTIKWSFKTGDGIECSPVIDKNGTIYICSHDGYLYAVNPDGTKKWKFNAGPPKYDSRWNVSKSMMATPAIASDGTIYIYSSAHYLFAINANGTEKWRYPMKWGNDFWSSPAIAKDGTIYVGSARNEDEKYPGGLYAINSDGTRKWVFEVVTGVTSSPAIGPDGTIYVGGSELSQDSSGKKGMDKGKVFAIYPNGKKKWEFTTERWMESSPAIASDGTIYIGSGREGKVFALDPYGNKKWEFQTKDGVSAIPALGKDGTVFIGSWDYNFYALDSNGKEKWRIYTGQAFEGVSSSAATGADGTIYFGSNNGKFYAVHQNGSVKWQLKKELGPLISSPAIGTDGTVYVGSWDGNLYAIGGSEKIKNNSFMLNKTMNKTIKNTTAVSIINKTEVKTAQNQSTQNMSNKSKQNYSATNITKKGSDINSTKNNLLAIYMIGLVVVITFAFIFWKKK